METLQNSQVYVDSLEGLKSEQHHLAPETSSWRLSIQSYFDEERAKIV